PHRRMGAAPGQIDDVMEPADLEAGLAGACGFAVEAVFEIAHRCGQARRVRHEDGAIAAIAGRLQARQGKALNNFKRTLPPADSDFAAQVFKDPYCSISSAPRIRATSKRSRCRWSRTSSASCWSSVPGSRSSDVRS